MLYDLSGYLRTFHTRAIKCIGSVAFFTVVGERGFLSCWPRATHDTEERQRTTWDSALERKPRDPAVTEIPMCEYPRFKRVYVRHALSTPVSKYFHWISMQCVRLHFMIAWQYCTPSEVMSSANISRVMCLELRHRWRYTWKSDRFTYTVAWPIPVRIYYFCSIVIGMQ